ncbi:hypothetical protein [Polaribacter cellanae]|uniref:Uncharacterized protein n=1 Tax=Polaribacter cellanae TaxID=2818493 RepID=A0A975H5U6_9FLAO|nr:hypothetical protein [Polaribacter cellanae]QTE21313.1 hypothetical protein J3359_10780 [Polaribacter cellanae]
MHGKDIGLIILSNRKEYEYHQMKVKEAKEKGNYSFDPEGGRDNLKIKVPTLTFQVISMKEVVITDCEISRLKLIDYQWIQNNSWKKIAKQPYDFKDIYFLYKKEKNNYVSYKVGLTIVEY